MVRMRSQSPRAADFSAACRAAFASLLAASSVAVGQLPDRVVGFTHPINPFQKGNAYEQVATFPTGLQGSSHSVSTALVSWGLFTPINITTGRLFAADHISGKTQDRLCLGLTTPAGAIGSMESIPTGPGLGAGAASNLLTFQGLFFPRHESL